MAIYHFSAKVLSRSNGRSAVAAAAYRAGEKIEDRTYGEERDYSRKSNVEHTAIYSPDGAPEWSTDRGELWNRAEEAEKRKDAQLSKEFELALPHELNAEQRKELVSDFAQNELVDRGMVADVAIHGADKNGDQRNAHAHVMTTTREIGPDGFGGKNREWNKREMLQDLRERWEEYQNRHLERAGREERVSHKSLEAQRGEAARAGDYHRAGELNRPPQVKKGVTLTQMERSANPEKQHYARGIIQEKQKAKDQEWSRDYQRRETQTRYNLDKSMYEGIKSGNWEQIESAREGAKIYEKYKIGEYTRESKMEMERRNKGSLSKDDIADISRDYGEEKYNKREGENQSRVAEARSAGRSILQEQKAKAEEQQQSRSPAESERKSERTQQQPQQQKKPEGRKKDPLKEMTAAQVPGDGTEAIPYMDIAAYVTAAEKVIKDVKESAEYAKAHKEQTDKLTEKKLKGYKSEIMSEWEKKQKEREKAHSEHRREYARLSKQRTIFNRKTIDAQMAEHKKAMGSIKSEYQRDKTTLERARRGERSVIDDRAEQRMAKREKEFLRVKKQIGDAHTKHRSAERRQERESRRRGRGGEGRGMER